MQNFQNCKFNLTRVIKYAIISYEKRIYICRVCRFPCSIQIESENEVCFPKVKCLLGDDNGGGDASWYEQCNEESDNQTLEELVKENTERIQKLIDRNKFIDVIKKTHKKPIPSKWFVCHGCGENISKESLINKNRCPSCRVFVLNNDGDSMEKIQKHYNSGGGVLLETKWVKYYRDRLKFKNFVHFYKIVNSKMPYEPGVWFFDGEPVEVVKTENGFCYCSTDSKLQDYCSNRLDLRLQKVQPSEKWGNKIK